MLDGWGRRDVVMLKLSGFVVVFCKERALLLIVRSSLDVESWSISCFRRTVTCFSYFLWPFHPLCSEELLFFPVLLPLFPINLSEYIMQLYTSHINGILFIFPDKLVFSEDDVSQ